jgi:FkbM family methyltransferase
MSHLSVRSTLASWLTRAASRLGLVRELKRLPGLYQPIRALLGPADRNAYLINKYEPAIVALAEQLCRPGMHVCDIGAHVGYFSLLFAVQAGPSGRVLVFEPNPANVAKIQAMARINQLTNVSVFPVAVSDRNGEVQFVAERTGSMGSIMPSTSTGSGRAMVVRTVRLDDELRGVDRIDLIKMDIEGAEVQALTGMTDLLMRCRPVLLCEWHPAAAGPGHADLFDRLGYDCELLEPMSATEPFHFVARPRRTAATGSTQ